jgi:acyl-CoA thioester hydrolase
MEHEIIKGEIVAATINIDGAWIDTVKRKLTVPPPEVIHIFDSAPRSASFTITEK